MNHSRSRLSGGTRLWTTLSLSALLVSSGLISGAQASQSVQAQELVSESTVFAVSEPEKQSSQAETNSAEEAPTEKEDADAASPKIRVRSLSTESDTVTQESKQATKKKQRIAKYHGAWMATSKTANGFLDVNGDLIKNHWVFYRDSYYFADPAGTPYRNRIISFGSNVRYYMNKEGKKSFGPIWVAGQLHLFDSRKLGKMNQDNAWVHYANKWYFPDSKGNLYHGRFIHFCPRMYYMNPDGSLRQSDVTLGNKVYQIASNGLVQTMTHRGNQAKQGDFLVAYQNGRLRLLDALTGRPYTKQGWFHLGNRSYFLNGQGDLYHDQFISFGASHRYYMSHLGAKLHKQIVSVAGNLFLLGEDGNVVTSNRWESYRGKQIFPNSKGLLYHNRFIYFGSQKYYMDANGYKTIGSFTISGVTYTTDQNGLVVKEEKKQEERAGYYDMDAPLSKLYSLRQFKFTGVIYWSGYKFTYYSQRVLPGYGLRIPGRHVNKDGYVCDKDGYIVLANNAPKGTVIQTPFGYYGKVYDRGTYGNHYDVYVD